MWCNLILKGLWGQWNSVLLWVPWVHAFFFVGEVAAVTIFAASSNAVVKALYVLSFHEAVVPGVLESGLWS